MRVLITDRKIWLHKVVTKLEEIDDERKRRVGQLELKRALETQTWWGRLWFDGVMFNWDMLNARCFLSETKSLLTGMLLGLRSQDTGDIYFNESEIAATEIEVVNRETK